MYYIFVINGRKDYRENIDADLKRQLAGTDIQYECYHTEGVGDGTRFVRIYCDLHRNREVCFIACGGSGTANEVASGIVGFKGKSMAIMAYGATNDFTKHYPERDFTDLSRILGGEEKRIDIIRANDSYSINVINAGFDAAVAHAAQQYQEQGITGVKAFKRGLLGSIMTHRINRMRITVDGERMNRRFVFLCVIGNASWYGGQYHCTPKARTDDGLMDVCVFRPMTLGEFFLILPKYKKGAHMEDGFSRKRFKYRQAKHIELDSRDLIYISNDGEIVASSHFDIDILPEAITILLPSLEKRQ